MNHLIQKVEDVLPFQSAEQTAVYMGITRSCWYRYRHSHRLPLYIQYSIESHLLNNPTVRKGLIELRQAQNQTSNTITRKNRLLHAEDTLHLTIKEAFTFFGISRTKWYEYRQSNIPPLPLIYSIDSHLLLSQSNIKKLKLERLSKS